MASILYRIMYNEYMMDIEIICSKSCLTNEETDAVRQFARENCDRLSCKAADIILLSAIRKLKQANTYYEFTRAIKLPKDWDADLEG